ncbi:MAG TPA: glycosyltransferase [Candidatus Binataceae bacterium]|nr:glycosyltransferase [Candidatus Binataceae bacterium]
MDLIFFNAGGGHRASAAGLKSILEQQQRPWDVHTINLREVLEPIDFIRKVTRVRVEDFYNRMLRHGLTIGTGPMLRVVQSLIRRMHAQATAMLQRYWTENPPDLVVSVIPNFNREIFEGLRSADKTLDRPPTPVVTILTDLADYPPHFWIERQEQYLICGTEAAMNQALAMGHRKDRVFRTSGMIVRPEFYNRPPIDLVQERARLGLRPDLPTGLVMFGGYGSRQMLTIARRVAAAGLKTQLIFMCGHNRQLAEKIAELELPFPYHIEGFSDDIPRFMQLADYFVGKPGPGSISEALVMGLPVVVERNSWTMVQERFNTDWIVENHLGVVLHSFAEVGAGILPMLDPDRLAAFREHVSLINNRAIFEIPEILAHLIANRPASRRSIGLPRLPENSSLSA